MIGDRKESTTSSGGGGEGVCKLCRRGDRVGQVCRGCIEGSTLVGTVGYIEASGWVISYEPCSA